MIKKILAVIVLVAFSSTSFALTQAEQDEYRTTVSEMGNIQYVASIGYNGATVIGSCGIGALYSFVNVAAEFVPGLSTIQSAFVVNSETSEREYLGGLGALLEDLGTAALDISDSDLDKPVLDEFWKAFEDSQEIAQVAFNDENGYCTNQVQQLAILFGF